MSLHLSRHLEGTKKSKAGSLAAKMSDAWSFLQQICLSTSPQQMACTAALHHCTEVKSTVLDAALIDSVGGLHSSVVFLNFRNYRLLQNFRSIAHMCEVRDLSLHWFRWGSAVDVAATMQRHSSATITVLPYSSLCPSSSNKVCYSQGVRVRVLSLPNLKASNSSQQQDLLLNQQDIGSVPTGGQPLVTASY